MYKCMNCGFEGEKPAAAYETDGSLNDVCECCKSEKIRIASEECSVCGAAIYKGDSAYEAGDMLICEKCITAVLV
ncbi:MAG: hypothetical protein IK093_08330 [Ruminiclostridium sp.]|nr:hypothetical protein [Ruminiclostridium sp.]